MEEPACTRRIISPTHRVQQASNDPMSGHVHLNAFDYIIFLAYVLATIALGFWVSRRGMQSTKEYFLGNRSLPWYVVGTSMVATDISTEQFIGNVGAAYKHGFVVAVLGWNSWIIYTLLIFIFLPCYWRTGVT